MLFSPVWVSLVSNISKDGSPRDTRIVGQVMTHDVITLMQPQVDSEGNPVLNEQGQQIAVPMPATRVGVCWEHSPVPAFHYYDPSNLYYLREHELEQYDMPESFFEEEEGEEYEEEGFSEGPSV